MSRIVRYFPETDLRGGHHMLSLAAAKEGIKIASVAVGEFLLFVNRKQTAFKMLTQGGVLVHFKTTGGRLNPATFAIIPKYFDGKTIAYDRALLETLKADYRVSTIAVPKSL